MWLLIVQSEIPFRGKNPAKEGGTESDGVAE